MKTARLLFAVAGFMALTIAIGFADAPPGQSSKPKVQEKHKTSDHSDDPKHGIGTGGKKEPAEGNQLKSRDDKHHRKPGADKHRPKPGDARQNSKSADDKHFPKPKDDSHASEMISQGNPMKSDSKPTPANGLPQSEPNKTAALPKTGTIMSKTGSQNTESAKLPVGGGTTPPAARVTRDHGATTAAIGGLAASNVKKSAAAVNGASLHRKF